MNLFKIIKPRRVRPNYCVVFGDSHQALYRSIKRLSPIHVGAVTMHRVGRDGSDIFSLLENEIIEGDALGFLFGEIDVRVHIAQQVKNGRQEQEIINTLLSRYFLVLRDMAIAVKPPRVALFSIPPPSGLNYPSFDVNYPRNGSDQDRVRWTTIINSCLAEGADRAGYVFIDQHSMFVNEAGLLDLEATDDGVHIRHSLVDRVDLRPIFA